MFPPYREMNSSVWGGTAWETTNASINPVWYSLGDVGSSLSTTYKASDILS